MEKSQSLIIAGMHRSHTSLLTEALQRAGLFIGDDLIPPASSNARGHFESRAVVNFHKKVIQDNGLSSWKNFIDGANAETVAQSQEFQQSAKDLLDRYFDVPLFGWKDPRSAFFLHGWDKVLPDAHYIFCIRHPSSSVQSLNRRSLQNKFLKYRPLLTYRHFNLWYETNIRLLQFAEAQPNKCLVLDLPEDIENKTKMDELNNCIQNTWRLKLNDIHFDGIYDKSLITSSKASRYVNFIYQRSRKIGQLYDRLLKLC